MDKGNQIAVVEEKQGHTFIQGQRSWGTSNEMNQRSHK